MSDSPNSIPLRPNQEMPRLNAHPLGTLLLRMCPLVAENPIGEILVTIAAIGSLVAAIVIVATTNVETCNAKCSPERPEAKVVILRANFPVDQETLFVAVSRFETLGNKLLGRAEMCVIREILPGENSCGDREILARKWRSILESAFEEKPSHLVGRVSPLSIAWWSDLDRVIVEKTRPFAKCMNLEEGTILIAAW